jgi:Ubiquitin-conjugating enzyme
MVKFLTTDGGRVRFNPNLYNSGKVCLSLLGTWHGPGWIPKKSTLLQVLISIQGLILVSEPFYNEPGHHKSRHTIPGSDRYNVDVRKNTVRVAIGQYLKGLIDGTFPYPEFSKVVRNHFLLRKDDIEQHLQKYLPVPTGYSREVLTNLQELYKTI